MKETKIGYVRVSSKKQNEERQMIAMKEAGILPRQIYMDKQSGKDFDKIVRKWQRRKMTLNEVCRVCNLPRSTAYDRLVKYLLEADGPEWLRE